MHPSNRPPIEDPLMLLPWALTKLYTAWLCATYPFASVGRGVSIHHTFKMTRTAAPRIKVGNSVTLGKDSWLNVIPEATDEVNILIGDSCRIGPRSCISAKNLIQLEPNVHLGPSVLIQDHGHMYENLTLPIRKQPAMPGGKIRIEQGCRIGQGVAILCSNGDLVLGQNCVVAPNSVVLRSAPPNSLLSGNPARVIEHLPSTHVTDSPFNTNESVFPRPSSLANSLQAAECHLDGIK